MNSGCLKIVCLRKLLFGEVKGICSPGSTSSFNDVALRDCQNWRINRPYRDAPRQATEARFILRLPSFGKPGNIGTVLFGFGACPVSKPLKPCSESDAAC